MASLRSYGLTAILPGKGKGGTGAEPRGGAPTTPINGQEGRLLRRLKGKAEQLEDERNHRTNRNQQIAEQVNRQSYEIVNRLGDVYYYVNSTDGNIPKDRGYLHD